MPLNLLLLIGLIEWTPTPVSCNVSKHVETVQGFNNIFTKVSADTVTPLHAS